MVSVPSSLWLGTKEKEILVLVLKSKVSPPPKAGHRGMKRIIQLIAILVLLRSCR